MGKFSTVPRQSNGRDEIVVSGLSSELLADRIFKRKGASDRWYCAEMYQYRLTNIAEMYLARKLLYDEMS